MQIHSNSYPKRFFKQLAALSYKNGLLSMRNWRSFLLRILTPPFFIFLVWVINKLVMAGNNLYNQFDTVRDPSPDYVDPIPSCDDSPFLREPCWDFFYTPMGNPIVEQIVEGIRTNNPGRVVPADKVRGFASREASNSWLLNNQLQVNGVFHFDPTNPKQIGVTIQTNSTNQWFRNQYSNPTFYMQLPMQVAAEREIARYYFDETGRDGSALSWSVALKLFAHPPYDSFSIVSTTAGPFIFAANMFGFVSLLSMLAIEKEQGLRQALRTMGMLDSTYWLSWMAYETIIGLVTSLLISAAGAACGFSLFLKNAFVLYFVLFWMFALAMTSFAMMMSVFLSKSSSAVYLGFALFIVGWISQVAVAFGYPYSPDSIDSVVPLTVIFTFMPWALLTKGIVDLGKAVQDPTDPGLNAGEAFSYCKNDKEMEIATADSRMNTFVDYDCVFSLGQVILALFGLWLFYFVLAVYLDNVLPNERGVRRPFYYFLLPSYWFNVGRGGLRRRKNKLQIHTPSGLQVLKPIIPRSTEGETVDSDVAQEEETMNNLLKELGDNTPAGREALDKYAVGVFGLQKVWRQFPGYYCGLKPEFWSVKGATFGIEKNQLLCLLGPNGAGKTTTINMLTGVIPASGGDATVYGQVLGSAGGIDRIRSMMGVCPQFDILWGELTGYEHMMIYALVKGLSVQQAKEQGVDLLGKVKLSEASGQMCGHYSGGMKRRLSVAIALLGDPKIVYLDEPTTGMDPISRRHVWDIIESAKVGRAIVLTTHSMEEADILGDRVAIMARGRLRAIGTSIRLKQKFGSGYQISVSVNKGPKDSVEGGSNPEAPFQLVKDYFKDQLGLAPADFTGAYMTFRVPQSVEPQLATFLANLESQSDQLGITDIQMSLTSLEEVFLNIAKQAEVEAAQVGGLSTVDVYLDNGKIMNVPLGAEECLEPASGVTYKITWAQDDNGALQILSWTPIAAPEPATGNTLT